MANVIPSFRGFASTPDFAGSYLGGARLALQEQEQINQVGFQQQRLANERARIAQQAEESAVSSQVAQMRIAAQQQIAQQEALRKSTDLDVEKAYNNARLGLQARSLDHDEQKLKAEVFQFQRRMEQGDAPSFQTRNTAEGIRSFNPKTGQIGEVVGNTPPTREAAEPIQRIPITPGEWPFSEPQTIGVRPSQMTPEFMATLPEHGRTNAVTKAAMGLNPNAQKQQQATEVRRKAKNGRTAIFNSQTKEFLRYAD